MSDFIDAVMDAIRGDVWEDDGWLCREFVFEANFPGFAGHFPGSPILPAIVQMMAGAILSTLLMGGSVDIHAVHNAKFFVPIPPDAAVTVYARAQGLDTAEIRIILEGRLASTFTLNFSVTA